MSTSLHFKILIKIVKLDNVNQEMKILNYVSTSLIRKDYLMRNFKRLLQSLRMLGKHTKFSTANPNGRRRRRWEDITYGD